MIHSVPWARNASKTFPKLDSHTWGGSPASFLEIPDPSRQHGLLKVVPGSWRFVQERRNRPSAPAIVKEFDPPSEARHANERQTDLASVWIENISARCHAVAPKNPDFSPLRNCRVLGIVFCCSAALSFGYSVAWIEQFLRSTCRSAHLYRYSSILFRLLPASAFSGKACRLAQFELQFAICRLDHAVQAIGNVAI